MNCSGWWSRARPAERQASIISGAGRGMSRSKKARWWCLAGSSGDTLARPVHESVGQNPAPTPNQAPRVLRIDAEEPRREEDDDLVITRAILPP